MSWTYKKDVDIFSHLYLALKENTLKPLKKKRVILIAGPTAVGKSSLAIKIAKILKGEIVSADSMQVYRGMDIGTAKVSKKDREGISHHMIDICDIDRNFNVVDFYNMAKDRIEDILRREKVPIVVGGAGFYIDALIYGPPAGPPSIAEVRKKLEEDMDRMGVEVLYERLQMMDPEYAATITERDRNKIIRALEIIYITKKRVSSFKKERREEGFFEWRCWFLTLAKESLYTKIEMRCEEMVEMGFLDEVKGLKDLGIERNRSASNAIGYRQALEFLEKKYSFSQFMENFKLATKRYVKKQLTWFKKDKLFRVLDLSKVDLEEALGYIIEDYEKGS